MRTWMMLPVVAWLTLASSAEAGEFTCKVPWYRGAVQCGDTFSLPAQQTVKIEVISVTDSDGTATPDDGPIFTIVDTNKGVNLYHTKNLRAKQTESFKNESKTTAVIVRLDATIDKMSTRVVHARYTITQ